MTYNLNNKDNASDEVQSKCGKDCSQCSYKEEYGCAGCNETADGYWGERCEIKECCKAYHLDHCGLCKSFPCEQLRELSYDSDPEGENLLNCKKWADNKKDSRLRFIKNILVGICCGIFAGVVLGVIYNMTAAFVTAGIIVGVGIALLLETGKRY